MSHESNNHSFKAVFHLALIIQGGPGNTTHPYLLKLLQVAEILLIMTQIGHFATRFLTKSKEMGTIWTSRFEDKSLNFIARYF